MEVCENCEKQYTKEDMISELRINPKTNVGKECWMCMDCVYDEQDLIDEEIESKLYDSEDFS
jgi:hypothetical protein